MYGRAWFTSDRRYNSVLNKRTGAVFYVDTSNEACYLTVPQQATLMWAFEHSEGTGRVLGQHREWEVNGTATTITEEDTAVIKTRHA